MLLPLLLLLWAWGVLAASTPVSPASVTLRLLQTTVFHNTSSVYVEWTALLGDLETHSLDCRTCSIRFLQPWAQEGLTPKQWQDLEKLIYNKLSDFIRMMNDLAKEEGERYPFVTQLSTGCELHPNGTSRPFCDAGMNGENFVSFDADTSKWVALRGDRLTLKAQEIMNWNRVVAITLQFLLRTTCVSEIKSFVQHGKASLERQERPVAVVFARAPPPAGTPAPFLLVCRVTGFYPRPVRVAWLQDGEEVGPGWRLNSSGILPNADLTYQLRSSLAVEPGAGHSYACRVEHSSLGGRSLLIPWEQSRRWGPGLAVGITLGAVAVVAVAVVLWWNRRRWFKDGQEQTARVMSPELLHNGDWTFQILLRLEPTPRHGDVDTCQVEPIRLQGPLTVHWEAQTDSARDKMLPGVGGSVLGSVFMVPGLLVYLKNTKAEWLRDGAGSPRT